MKPIVIGIGGGTGSGKTTLVNRIKERFGKDVCVVSHDSYYKDHPELPLAERKKLNYDQPDAFETDLMVRDVEALRRGESIFCPVYDYSIYNRSGKTIRIDPAKVILLEGIMIFENKALRDLMDIKVFVDADADVRLLRRLARDVNTRGRTLESVMQQYLETVKPMHEQYVEPTKKFCDIVVPGGGQNQVALDLLISRIAAHLTEE